mgnify:CR=1 FL=1
MLRDVRHVLEVRLNLISAGRLDDEGYIGSIRNGVMKFCKGSLISVFKEFQARAERETVRTLKAV